ncbi:Uncharacterised protein [uncultured Blautia sp.]|nr:Uncharacterised protein [uncultured Blautia sp.]
MKKIERRAFACLALALLLAAGLGFFLVKYFLDGGSWASSAFNRHLYNSSGQLASGTVLDRDGDVLSEVVTIPPMRRLAASPAPWRSTTTKPERFCVWSQPPATTP